MKHLITTVFFISIVLFAGAQTEEAYQKVKAEIDRQALNEIREAALQKQETDRAKIEELQRRLGTSLVFNVEEDGTVTRLVGFDEVGFPVFYETDNVDAAISTNTIPVKQGGSSGYNLSGNGIIVGEWDGGPVRETHQEFGSRVVIQDAGSSSSHATHVAGTIMAAGVDNAAEGMANNATLWSWDFFGDTPDMSTFASGGNILSNHSYGTIAGWRYRSQDTMWYWYGDTAIDPNLDGSFGRYNFTAAQWDAMVFSNPYYAIVKSAGNDRGTAGPTSGSGEHRIWDSGAGAWVPSFTSRPPSCPTGYNCISTAGNSKNIITVGAVNDVPNYSGSSSVVMSSFSGWGPTDDGRIKPDIVGNGVGVYSADNGNDTDYDTKSGTSMSGPNIAGNIALLQELSNNTNSSFLKASSIKALIIETALPAGNGVAPDYEFGWGLMNTAAAADVIAGSVNDTIIEDVLNTGNTYSFQVYSDGTGPLSVTTAWTDPAGQGSSNSFNDTTPVLVNDLDLRITDVSNNSFLPFVLDPANPSAAASTGNNRLDNVEKVYIANPAPGWYTVEISHKGTLTGGSQEFSVVSTGKSTPAPASSSNLDALFTSTDSAGCEGLSVTFSDITAGEVVTRTWSFPGGTPATSSDSTLSVVYNQAGNYNVTLIVEDTAGNFDTTAISNFITVDTATVVDLSANPDTVCLNSGLVSLLAQPAGGSWSGLAVSGSDFNPDTAGTGTHDLVYTFINGACITQDTFTVEVVMPTITVSHLSDTVCETATPFVPQGASIPGGSYSGPGITGNMFYPDSTQWTSSNIVYSILDSATGCLSTDTFQIWVDTVPVVAFPDTAFCENEPPITVNWVNPSGGVLTGVGMDGPQDFVPPLAGVGVSQVFYEYTRWACTVNDTAEFEVFAAPNVTFTLSDTFYCDSDSAFALNTGLPAGGVYSGMGVTGNAFDPAAAGIGVHTVLYAYADSNGCADSSSVMIEVDSCVAQPPIASSDTMICTGDEITFFNLDSNLAAQSFEWAFPSGSPATSTDSNPQVRYDTAGFYDVFLYVTDTTGITDTFLLWNFIQVDTAPSPQVSFFNTTCIDLGTTPIARSPLGGVLSGSAGISGNNFTAANAGFGPQQIIYTVTNGGCVRSDTHVTNVVDTPSVSHPDLGQICDGSTPFNPGLGTPPGGMYNGPGVMNNLFYPDSAGLGIHQIEYYYVDSNNCDNSDTFTVEVVPGAGVSLSNLPGICDNDATFSLSTGNPAGGIYSGAGIDSGAGTFDPSAAGSGITNYLYTVNTGSCNAVDTGIIEVSASPNVNLARQALVCIGADTVNLSGGTPQGGTYSGANVFNNQFVTPANTGSFVIDYEFTDTLTGCVNSDTAVLEVVNSVNVSMRDSSGICSTSESFDLELGDPFGGIYSGPGIVNVGKKFKPENVGAGSFQIIYNYDTNGCAGADTATLTVIQGPQIDFNPLTELCITDDTLELNANPAGGVFSGDFVAGSVFLPSQAGVGSYNVTYGVTDTTTGCYAEKTVAIEVTDGNAEISIPDTVYCENDSPVTLSGNPVPGNFAGPGVFGVSFNPDAANAGLHRIEYRTILGCIDTAEVWVRVHPAPRLGPINGPATGSHFINYAYSIPGASGENYNWSVVGGTIVNDNNNSVTVRWGTGTVGILRVFKTNSFGCSDTAELRIDLAPLSVEESGLIAGISVYPNPTSDLVNIEGYNGQNRPLDYRLTDAVGRSLQTGILQPGEVREVLNLNQLSGGVYFLVVQGNNTQVVKKIVKQ